jgi:hypothetical protein
VAGALRGTDLFELRLADRRTSVVRPSGVKFGRVVVVAVVALAGCATATTPPGSSAVVHGQVLAAPGCPVERADSPCPAIRVAGARVIASTGETEVARVVSAGDGSFTLTLPPGTYTLEATTSNGYRSSANQVVRLQESTAQQVTITLDSGIR